MELRQIAQTLRSNGMGCNCDLDSWEPEDSTGHSHVCRIHKTAIAAKYQPYDLSPELRELLDRAAPNGAAANPASVQREKDGGSDA